jgi:hypothetical protein
MKTFKGSFIRVVEHVNYEHEIQQDYEVTYEKDDEGFVTILKIEEKPDPCFREVKEDSWLWDDININFRTDINDKEIDDDRTDHL